MVLRRAYLLGPALVEDVLIFLLEVVVAQVVEPRVDRLEVVRQEVLDVILEFQGLHDTIDPLIDVSVDVLRLHDTIDPLIDESVDVLRQALGPSLSNHALLPCR